MHQGACGLLVIIDLHSLLSVPNLIERRPTFVGILVSEIEPFEDRDAPQEQRLVIVILGWLLDELRNVAGFVRPANASG